MSCNTNALYFDAVFFVIFFKVCRVFGAFFAIVSNDEIA